MGVEGFDGQGDAGDESAAADGDDDGVDVLDLFDDLEAHGALSGDDVRVVVAVDVGQPQVGGHAHGVLARLAQIAAVDDDAGAELAARLHLHDGRHDRHHHRHRDAQLLAVVGQAQRVVAGRGRDHA